ETANALAEFKGEILKLNGLTSLDAETAKALAEFKGEDLGLVGLTSLDAETAKVLAEFKVDFLNLSGLTSLDAETAKALAEFKGETLILDGLTELTPEALKALAKWEGKGLNIDHLNAISRSSQAARSTKGDLPKAGPSQMPKRPAQVAADPPVAAQQSGTPAWQWLLGAAFLLSALVVYLAGKRKTYRNIPPKRPPHKIS
ncbi:MAG: hypothetical protein ACK46A_01390, partial [Akkermansiaceae bacterium]